MKTNWFFSVFSDIRKKYSVFLNILVSISSVFFILWLLLVFFVRGEKSFTLIFLLAVFIATMLLYSEQEEKERNDLLLYNPQKSENIKKINDYLRVLGSIIFLFLFINLYLRISDFLSQQFLSIWKNIELILNLFGFIFLFVATFFLMFLVGFVFWFNFTSFIIKDKEKMKKTGRSLVFFYLVFSYFVLPYLMFRFSLVFYEEIGLVFGFSLLFLHLNYLMKRLIVLFDRESDLLS